MGEICSILTLCTVVRKSCSVADLERYLGDFLLGGEANTDECTQIMVAFFAPVLKWVFQLQLKT